MLYSENFLSLFLNLLAWTPVSATNFESLPGILLPKKNLIAEIFDISPRLCLLKCQTICACESIGFRLKTCSFYKGIPVKKSDESVLNKRPRFRIYFAREFENSNGTLNKLSYFPDVICGKSKTDVCAEVCGPWGDWFLIGAGNNKWTAERRCHGYLHSNRTKKVSFTQEWKREILIRSKLSFIKFLNLNK